MCQPTPCRQCGKITWTGCGAHIAEVQASVPAEQWCPGHEPTDHSVSHARHGLI